MFLRPDGYQGTFSLKDPWDFNEKRKYAPMAFIWAPFDGDADKYAEMVRPWCLFAYKKGYIPIAPHMMFSRIWPGTDEDSEVMRCMNAANLMLKCDEFWVIATGDLPVKNHMMFELINALKRGKPTRFLKEDDMNE